MHTPLKTATPQCISKGHLEIIIHTQLAAGRVTLPKARVITENTLKILFDLFVL